MADALSVVHALQDNARRRGAQLAYQFLIDGEREGTRYTFAELDARARATAALIRRHTQDRAMLLFPDAAGAEFVAAYLGCLYAGVIAVPSFPPNPSRPERTLARMKAIAHDSKIDVVLTTAEVAAQATGWGALVPGMEALRYVATDTADLALASELREALPRPETICFLQYTSGSTSAPRAVAVSHANLVHNCHYTARAFRLHDASVNVSWCPVGHDMGLIMGLLTPLVRGVPTYHLSPSAFIQAPPRWVNAVSRYRATYSGGPNFSFDLCVRKVDDAQLQALDLSSWEAAYNGAEPVRPTTIARFFEKFSKVGFRARSHRPAYGMAEATVLVSTVQDDQTTVVQTVDADALANGQFRPTAPGGRSHELASAGRVVDGMGMEVAAVNPDTLARCGPEEIGELWIRGPSVAQGYWEKPEANARTFDARCADGTTGWLRSGDLGAVRDGLIFVTGRSKDLIILSGRNAYPQDLELAAEESHPVLRKGCAAAFSIDTGADEQVVLLIEVDKAHLETAKAEVKTIAGAVRRAVAEACEVMLSRVVLLAPSSVLKTTSGKIQRAGCRAAYLGGKLPGLLAEDTLAPRPSAPVPRR